MTILKFENFSKTNPYSFDLETQTTFDLLLLFLNLHSIKI
jgi:hypothetical protein